MKTKAVVLAAGEGKRMKPVSDFVAKEMIPILGKPFLYYVLQQIKDAGINDVIIVTNPRKEQTMKAELTDNLGLSLTYVIQEQQLGPAHALLQAREHIDTEYFLVQYGDSLADTNIAKALLNELQKNSDADAVLSTRAVDDPSRYGILRFDGHKIVEIVEKPAAGTEPSHMATMGVYVMNTKKFFSSLENKQFEYGKELFPPQYILLTNGKAVGWKFEGKRVDMGKPEDMLNASLLINKQQPTHVAFDADNTLYTTRAVAKAADMEAMNVLARRTTLSAGELYSRWYNMTEPIRSSPDPKIRHRRYSYNMLCKELGVDCVEEMYKAFVSTVLEKIRPVGQIKSLIENSKKKLYAITEDNRMMATEKLQMLGLFQHFSDLITSDDVGVMKPSERYYEKLLKTAKPSDILVVGDNYEKDLFVPAKLGMHVYLVQKPEDLEILKKVL